MKIYICRICGEVYIGENIPPSCPFCGAHQKYLQLGHVWKDENEGVVPNEIEKKNLEEALKLELSNTSFYQCVSKTVTNTEIAKMFKGLAKVEKEHAEVFQKLLQLKELPQIEESCTDDAKAILGESLAREQRATDFYSKALAEATDERIKTVFEAIMNVEKDHIELDKSMKNKFQ
jgi:rubrerythrin